LKRNGEVNYKYYIWDVGGTLFDTLKALVKAFGNNEAKIEVKVS
jgi:hypothetical protein